jgi:hypothetical protein
MTNPAVVTETELAAWLTETVGPKIVDDYGTTTDRLLTVFDFAEKGGRSLNNPYKIGSVISPTPALTSEPFAPYVPLTAAAAAQHLTEVFHVTRKPADYAQIVVDLPMPVIVQRHQCPFCRRYTRADLRQVQDHMTRCWQNPALRCCKTCVHHQDASGTPGSPDEWEESCTRPDGPEEYRFPVLHCPLWETK